MNNVFFAVHTLDDVCDCLNRFQKTVDRRIAWLSLGLGMCMVAVDGCTKKIKKLTEEVEELKSKGA